MKVLEVRFAETIKIGPNQEEISINVNLPKHFHYEMFRDSIGMLWIHDKDKDVWVGTSSANLRYILVDKPPIGLMDEDNSRESIRRINKEGEIRKTKG